MGETSATSAVQEAVGDVLPYSMHVSSRYLELTKTKLQYTRLPREIQLSERRRWELGTPKAVLEPLLDYWLETYSWREQESHFNTSLPQFRTVIQIPLSSPSSSSSRSSTPTTPTPTNPQSPSPSLSLRIHFVHKRSKHKNAIPLRFCHNWPSSFIEVHKVIDALTDPQSLPSFGAGAQQAFHVVAPSIPGFGFSDAGTVEEFGLRETAAAFDGVMRRLGYEQYVTHGTGWGFNICRALALGHPQNCLAVHTANPSFLEPTLKRNPLVYIKHRIARLTQARYFNFGYTPSEVEQHPSSSVPKDPEHQASHDHNPVGPTLAPLYALRPHTLAFSLCDSPIGLLAGLLDVIHTRAPPSSTSPFLSPVELEMEEARNNSADAAGQTQDDIQPGSTRQDSPPFSPREAELNSRIYTWSPTEVLNWTMLQWLPGPEGSLRWLRRATLDTAPNTTFSQSYCPVPLGISSFQARNNCSAPSTPLMWGTASWRIAWVKRHQRPASVSPAWEAPDLLVLDMRECFGSLLSSGAVNLPFQES